MATQKAISANAQRPQTGMTILFPGNAGSLVTQQLGIDTIGYHSGTNGSRIPAALSDATIAANTNGDTEPAAGRSKNPTYKPISAGTYANMEKGVYIAKCLSTTIAGVANTTLYSGAADFGIRRSIHKIHNIRTAFLTVWTWTGAKDGGPVYTKTVSVKGPQSNDYGRDDAADSSKAAPGELQYMFGSKDPVLADYPAR